MDFNSGYVMIVQSLKKGGNVGPTKAHKETMHELPAFLLPLLSEWKKDQEKQLRAAKFDFTPQQFIFTYTTMKGEVNHPLHSDYLNYRLKGVYRRHKDLQYVTPHKLRHSFSTIARQGGASMQLISEALSHSDTKTTRIYVNTPDVVGLEVHDKFAQRIAEARAASLKKEETMYAHR